MARRSDHSHEEISSLAIQAGLEMVREHGPTGLSGRKVAGAIGYTVGTIYNVFGSYDLYKLRLCAVILDGWFSSISDMLLQEPAPEHLQKLVRFYISYSHQHANHWRLLFNDSEPAPDDLPEWYHDKITRLFGMVIDTVRQSFSCSREQGKWQAEVLWTGIHGIVALSLSGKLDLIGAEKLDTLADNFMQIFLCGARRAA